MSVFRFAALVPLLALAACYADKGNYDYRAINEITIGARGFDGTDYRFRSGVDVLEIVPEIAASQDPDLSGDYAYEWVAVGQVTDRGRRTVLATTRDLHYPVALPSDEYALYLRITDPRTGLTFSRSTSMSVSTAFTRGWLLATEDSDGNAVVDMVSISRDTLLLRDVLTDEAPRKAPRAVWCDNDEYTVQNHGRVYLSTAEGCFLYDRETLAADEYTVLRNYFANPAYLDACSASDMIQIDDKVRIFLVDGCAYKYSISSANTGYFGNPVNRYSGSYAYVRIGDRMAYNLSGGAGAGAITTVMFYNDTDKRFCFVQRNDETLRDATDTEADLALFAWQTGLDYVTTFNSRFHGGQSATILRDPAAGTRWLYVYTVQRSGYVKNGRYELPASVAEEAANWCMTAQNGYLLYSVGGALWGYDFRNGREPVRLLDFGPETVTLLHNDIHTAAEGSSDCLYVCTYAEGTPASGRVRKYALADSADRIELLEQPEVQWSGFGPIRSMWFKEL